MKREVRQRLRALGIPGGIEWMELSPSGENLEDRAPFEHVCDPIHAFVPGKDLSFQH
jgi:hypothetical protein